MRRRHALALTVALALASVSGKCGPVDGTEGAACRCDNCGPPNLINPNFVRTCDTGLICNKVVCIKPFTVPLGAPCDNDEACVEPLVCHDLSCAEEPADAGKD